MRKHANHLNVTSYHILSNKGCQQQKQLQKQNVLKTECLRLKSVYAPDRLHVWKQ